MLQHPRLVLLLGLLPHEELLGSLGMRRSTSIQGLSCLLMSSMQDILVQSGHALSARGEREVGERRGSQRRGMQRRWCTCARTRVHRSALSVQCGLSELNHVSAFARQLMCTIPNADVHRLHHDGELARQQAAALRRPAGSQGTLHPKP